MRTDLNARHKFMPELPEVETVVRDLNKKIKGEVVASFWSDWKKGIRGGYKNFSETIAGKKIAGAERIGKNILINLSGGLTIIVHLRMTGALIMKPKNSIKARLYPPNKKFVGIPQSQALDKHVHHIFYFRNGKILEFSDVRKFGSLEAAETKKIKDSFSLKKLGPDAISKKFVFQEFDKILGKSKKKIKQLLLDQEKIAGIGNIYASEILFSAGISPQKQVDKLQTSEKKALFQSIGKVLKKAIKLRGTTISDFRDASGRRGQFQSHLNVYGKTGQKCKRCGTIIRRSVLGQRSTFHCPSCQK